MKHTPGPWFINRARKPDNTGGYDYAIDEGHEKILAETFEHVGWQDNSKKEYEKFPAEANARLIAAAPELLEACKAALMELSGLSNGKECIQLKQAIAKAEGAI